eukprot:TRINITY_DN14092_c0_g1_i1.p1 TRINITY_DN14092_c0_g1~~TRINITY_DN14092_c0_g1_i1.p1  ORF type:complete len:258 (-),score=38.93 TRINITY_DN14092_c0_g1_i1:28-801(-)
MFVTTPAQHHSLLIICIVFLSSLTHTKADCYCIFDCTCCSQLYVPHITDPVQICASVHREFGPFQLTANNTQLEQVENLNQKTACYESPERFNEETLNYSPKYRICVVKRFPLDKAGHYQSISPGDPDQDQNFGDSSSLKISECKPDLPYRNDQVEIEGASLTSTKRCEDEAHLNNNDEEDRRLAQKPQKEVCVSGFLVLDGIHFEPSLFGCYETTANVVPSMMSGASTSQPDDGDPALTFLAVVQFLFEFIVEVLL